MIVAYKQGVDNDRRLNSLSLMSFAKGHSLDKHGSLLEYGRGRSCFYGSKSARSERTFPESNDRGLFEWPPTFGIFYFGLSGISRIIKQNPEQSAKESIRDINLKNHA